MNNVETSQDVNTGPAALTIIHFFLIVHIYHKDIHIILI